MRSRDLTETEKQGPESTMHPTTTYAKRHRRNTRRNGDSDKGTAELSLSCAESQLNEPDLNTKRKLGKEDDFDSERPKKRKLSKVVDKRGPSMSVQPFQTPFPSLQTQSQVFRLPSSSPKHTPGILSPVPAVLHTVHTSTQKLKEASSRKTVGSDKLWYSSSKTLSCVTLNSSHFDPGEMSGPALHVRSPRNDRSRSTSRSSSNSSAISTTLKDTQKSHSALKHSKSLTSMKADGKPKRKHKQKPGKRGRPSSAKSTDDKHLSLASPFVTRSSSPVKVYADQKQNAPDYAYQERDFTSMPLAMGKPSVVQRDLNHESANRVRSALSHTFFNANLPEPQNKSLFPSREMRKGLGHTSQSANTSPHHGTRIKSQKLPENISPKFGASSRTEGPSNLFGYKIGKRNHFAEQEKHLIDRERRPSAPSSLSIPRVQRKYNLASIPPRHMNGEQTPASAPINGGRIRLGSGLSIVLATASKQAVSGIGLNGDPRHPDNISLDQKHPDSNIEWMHSRGAVDFNRPPSQMSFVPNGGIGFEYPDVEGEVFFSSSSDEDDHQRYHVSNADQGPGQNRTWGRAPMATGKEASRRKSDFGFDDPPALPNFGEDIWGASTPFKDAALHLGTDLGLKTKDRNERSLDLGDDRRETDLSVINAKKQRRDQEREETYTLIRSVSLPNFKTSPDCSNLASSSSLGLGSAKNLKVWTRKAAGPTAEKIEEDGEIDRDGEIDMELTGSLITRVVSLGERGEGRGESGGDWTPWVTDSIISPPTTYLKREIGKGGTGVGDKISDGDSDGDRRDEEQGTIVSSSSSDSQHQPLSSPFRLSSDDRIAEVSDDGVARQKDLHKLEQSALKSYIGSETAAKAVLSEPEVEDTTVPIEGVHISANTKRTRSGTIVPIGAPIPPGTRRTRGGTIVGPLPVAAPTIPLPSVPMDVSGYDADLTTGIAPVFNRRSRSGTITGPTPIAISRRTDGDSTRIETSVNDVEPLRSDEVEDIECYMDSMYLPTLTSSPDPIDFLRFASIVEEEEEHYGPTEFGSARRCGTDTKEIAWQVAEDPPSPEVVKRRGNEIFRGMGLGGKGWSSAGRAARKRKPPKKTRFTGNGASEDEAEDEDIGRNGDTEMSDDELLLLPGAAGYFEPSWRRFP